MVTTPLTGLRYYHLHLGPGEDLFGSLRAFLDAEGLSRAFLLSAIGSLRKVFVNYPASVSDNPEIRSVVLEGAYEINGIAGEVWREDGGVRVHLHGSVTREAGTLFGGGLGEGAVVLKLAELVLAGVK